MKEIWSTIIVPELRRATGEAGMALSQSHGTTPTGVKSLFEWETAIYKSNAATHDIRHAPKF
eukprot:6052824-Pyramimonas_sp.AAC.1